MGDIGLDDINIFNEGYGDNDININNTDKDIGTSTNTSTGTNTGKDLINDADGDTAGSVEHEDALADNPVEIIKKKHDDMVDRWQRTLAEFDNFRKRTAKEKSTMYDMGVADTVERLLPAVDNFERALTAARETENGFYKGVEMIIRQIGQVFKDMGVEEIACLGEKFDHRYHDAVAHVEDASRGSGEIIEELQKGYKYKDRIIRHSMVKVAN